MAELAAAKAQNTNLEEQIKKLQHVRLELDVVYDKENKPDKAAGTGQRNGKSFY